MNLFIGYVNKYVVGCVKGTISLTRDTIMDKTTSQLQGDYGLVGNISTYCILYRTNYEKN